MLRSSANRLIGASTRVMPLRVTAAVCLMGACAASMALEAPAPAPAPRDSAMRMSVADTPGAQMQRDREQRDAESRLRELLAPDVRPAQAHETGVEPDATALPVETPCFTIARFELTVPDTLPERARRAGASALPQDPFAFAAAWLDRYRGQCIGERGVQHVAEQLGAQILERGYLTTRIQIVPQDLSTHVLKLSLVPGLIHEIRFADPTLLASWRTAFPVREGDILRLADIEQALVQFKQVPGQDANFRIEPAIEPGQSDIVISLTRDKPWRVTGVIDNGGIDATGKLQGTLSASVDNPLGINDRLSATLSHDLMIGQRGRRSNAWSAFYAVPHGYWSTSLTAYGSGYSQNVAGRHKTFSSSGRSLVFEGQIARHLLRTRAATLGMQFKIGKRFGRSYIEDYEIGVQRRNNTYAQWALLERHHMGRAQIDTSLAWRQGMPWFGAHPDAHGDAATYLYRMALLDTNLSLPMQVGTRPLVYTTAFHGQWTADRLHQVDQLAIGTRWTVRGFDGEHMLSAERGFYWRNDLAMPLGRSGHSVYFGVDYGQVFGPGAASLAGTRLAGAVIGVRGFAGRRAAAGRTAVAAAPEMTAGTGAGTSVKSNGRGSVGSPPVLADPASADPSLAAGDVHGAGEASLPGEVSRSAEMNRAGAATRMPDFNRPWFAQVPGVFSYDLYAGTPLWKPPGFPTANLSVGFQLAYQY